MKEGKPIPEHKMLKLQTFDNLFPRFRRYSLKLVVESRIETFRFWDEDDYEHVLS